MSENVVGCKIVAEFVEGEGVPPADLSALWLLNSTQRSCGFFFVVTSLCIRRSSRQEYALFGQCLTMDRASAVRPQGMACNLCRYPGGDLRVLGCGCIVHAVSRLAWRETFSLPVAGAFLNPFCAFAARRDAVRCRLSLMRAERTTEASEPSHLRTAPRRCRAPFARRGPQRVFVSFPSIFAT